MAFVSKVTAERRDLRELEHMLSAREHESRDNLDEQAGGGDSPLRTHRMPLGIEPSGEFAEYVRCCAIVIIDTDLEDQNHNNNYQRQLMQNNNNNNQTQSSAAAVEGVRGRELWIGDRDGEIQVTLAVDGTPSYDSITGWPRLINAFPGTFPTSLAQVTFRDVWICFQDGMIRAFDISTLKPRFEMRRHCGAVTSIEVVESANIVATCSEDFLIYVWEGPPRSRQSKPSTELPKLIGKFAGHTNYVRAMCASPSGHHLFTGGADGTVRCYDLVRHVPLTVTDVVESNAAVLGHRAESVQCTRNARDIFYLFLHDVGSMLGVVSKTAVTIYVIATSAVHCIFEANNSSIDKNVTFVSALYCESTGQLWVGRSDGVIAVYDLHTFELSGAVDAHMNTVVQLIQFATCAATVRVVAASGSCICGKDSNSDVQLESNNQARDDMKNLVQVFKIQREKRQASERDLAVMNRQLAGLKNYDQLFKERISNALMRCDFDLAQRRALQRVRFFVLKSKHKHKAEVCSTAMLAKNRQHLTARYFHDWFRFWTSRQTQAAKKCVSGAITRMTERSLQSRYFQRALVTLRRNVLTERIKQRAHILSNVNCYRKRAELFTMWRRWMMLRATAKRREDFSNMTLRYNAEIARSVSWTGLFVGAHNARTMAVRKRLATAICSINQRNQMRSLFGLLERNRRAKVYDKKKVRAAQTVELRNNNLIRARYFHTLLDRVKANGLVKLKKKTDDLNKRLDELTGMLEDENVEKLSPDQVSTAITDVEKEIDKEQEEVKSLKKKLQAVEDYTRDMRRETAALANASFEAKERSVASAASEQEKQPSTTAAAASGGSEEGESNTTAASASFYSQGNPIAEIDDSMEILTTKLPFDMQSFSSTIESVLSPPKKAHSPTRSRSGGGARSSRPSGKRAAPASKPTAKRAGSGTRGRSTTSSSRGTSGSPPSSRTHSPSGGKCQHEEELKKSADALIEALSAALEAYPLQEEGKKQQQQKQEGEEKKQDQTRSLIPEETPTTSTHSAPAEPVTTTAETSEAKPVENKPQHEEENKPASASSSEGEQKPQEKPQEQQQQQQGETAAASATPSAQQEEAAPNKKEEPTVTEKSAWTAQRDELSKKFDEQKAAPSDNFRAVWENFNKFADNSNKALVMYSVFKQSRKVSAIVAPNEFSTAAQQQTHLSEETRGKFDSTEKIISANVDALAERIQFAREYPEISSTPVPPPPKPVEESPPTSGRRPHGKRASSKPSAKRSSSSPSAKPSAKRSSSSSSSRASPSAKPGSKPSTKPSTKPSGKRAASKPSAKR